MLARRRCGSETAEGVGFKPPDRRGQAAARPLAEPGLDDATDWPLAPGPGGGEPGYKAGVEDLDNRGRGNRKKRKHPGKSPTLRAAEDGGGKASGPTHGPRLEPRRESDLASALSFGPALLPRPTSGAARGLAFLPHAVEIRLPPVTEIRRFNTTRLLPAKYSESVLTRIADSDEDLQLIFALESATNERLLAEQNLRLGISARELVFAVPHSRIINAAFTHPHPQGGRFSMPYRGAWYAGLELLTAKAEVLFHRTLQFTEIDWRQPEELEYDQYLADFSGGFHDLRPEAFAEAQGKRSLDPGSGAAITVANDDGAEGRLGSVHGVAVAAVEQAEFAACLDPGSYIASQQLALDLLEAGSLGIVYPSTRRGSGHCVACFRPGLVCNVRKRDLFRLTWFPDRPATFLRCSREKAGPSPNAAAHVRPPS